MGSQIRLQFRSTENDFTLMLNPVSLTEGEQIFNVNSFITTANLSRATSGELPVYRQVEKSFLKGDIDASERFPSQCVLL